MPTDPRARRALRLACGTALCLAASFGLGLPLPFIAPLLATFLLARLKQPLPLKACLGLIVLVVLTTSGGLLLIPLLQHTPLAALLLVAVALFLAFRRGLRGSGSTLVTTFLVIGLTMISALGSVEFDLALAVIGALVQGLLLAVLALWIGHVLFPEPPGVTPAPAVTPLSEDADWIALQATLVVMPAYLLALIDPSAYLAIILKAVSLGQQSGGTPVRTAVRELLGSTLLGGLLAMLFWWALGLFVHLWMFFLWMLLVGLLLARKLYGLRPSRQSPGFWLNTQATMLILLGLSVQDSANGQDVYHAFAVRMSLFIAINLYASLMVLLLDPLRLRRRGRRSVGSM